MLNNANGSPIQQPKAMKISSVKSQNGKTNCRLVSHKTPLHSTQINHTGGMKARHKTVHNVSPKSKEQSELACVERGFLSSDKGVAHPETLGSGDARPDAGAGYGGVSASEFIQLNVYHMSIVYISVLYFLT